MSSQTSSDDASSTRRPGRYLLLALAAALLLAVWGIFSRLEARAALRKAAAETAIQTVAFTTAQHGTGSEELVLPGSVQAYADAPIYARTSGYLKRWLVDIGTPVKSGQLLAEIDAPEVDQQLRQAEADLATARANNELAQSTAKRWKELLATDSVSKQDADEKLSDAAAKQALVDSAAANVARLRELASFKRIVAPFDGVITARNTDIGALISAGTGTPGQALFQIAATSRLRVYVQVPQSYAPQTRVGIPAELHFAERPGRSYPVRIVSTANALDPGTRNLLVQLEADNSQGELFPGAYGEVHFKLPTRADTVRLPANTLLFRGDGLQVATLGPDDKVQLKAVSLGRDFGAEVEVLSGVNLGERVIVNPPDSIADGAAVRIAQPPAEQHAPAPAAGAGK
jgi:RND family efflux transporter MFP subunit